MSKLDEQLDKLDFQSKYNKSIKELSNWLLGIAIGLFTITVVKFDNTSVENTNKFEYHDVMIIITMLNLLFSGFIKHAIYVRELKLSSIYMETKRLVYFEKKLITREEYETRMNKTSRDSIEQHNRGIEIGRLLNYNTTSNLISLIMFGILVFLK